MAERLKLMCVLAHPDDESMGTGGILAKYSAEGVDTYLVTATRGEKGWFGPEGEYPGPEKLGQIREGELRRAAEELGLKEVRFLDYIDGELDQANPNKVVPEIVAHLRRVKPEVVVTFDPFGNYGHPDHIAISQFTNAAVVAGADPGFDAGVGLPPHRVRKLYYFVETVEKMAKYESIFGDLTMQVGDQVREPQPWIEWAVTTKLDTTEYFDEVWAAIRCHRTQLPGFEQLMDLPEEDQKFLFGDQTLYRAYSLVNNGRAVEPDLFQGLRE